MSAHAFRLVLLAIVVSAGPFAAAGQAPPRVPTIGVLSPGSPAATGARRPSDLEPIFAEIAAARVGALLVRADPLILEPNAKRLLTLAIKHRLIEVHRRSAFYVHRILHGARPADLPVEEPTRLVMVLNLKTARAIGLTFPADVRARADEILQ